MEWRDEGVIIGLKKHGESSVILEAMTRAHGRHLGLVRGGRSRRHAAALQPGNSVALTWHARLEDHLGMYEVEPTSLRAARFIDSAAALYALSIVSTHLRLLAEREVHEDLYEALLVLIDHLTVPRTIAALLARFELALLGELGFGLDLDACAATGTTQDLIYVSPKSGRAVCATAGAPYADRLLPLPAFLRIGEGTDVPPGALQQGLKLTGYFLERRVLEPRGLIMPNQRTALIVLAGE